MTMSGLIDGLFAARRCRSDRREAAVELPESFATVTVVEAPKTEL
jgi:hypothetical protein